jgi:hypothetical protein
MQVFRLLSRVAFICNICFLLASFIQWLPHPPEGFLVNRILELGYLCSLIFNFVVGVSVVILFVIGKLRAAAIPAWLLIINLLFFILQIILLIISQK